MEGAGLRRSDALDGERDLVRVFHPAHFVHVHAAVADVPLLELFLKAFGGLLQVRLDGVLHLHLHHQVGAALQVQPQTNVLAEVVLEFGAALRDADDTEYAQQQDHNNHYRAPGQICLHGI